MVKKYTSLFLVALLVIHLAGFYVYFIVRLGDLRMTMREKLAGLPAEQLEMVRIPVEQFNSSWMQEKEMEWQGRMYDIARVEREGKSMIVFCIHDKDEDSLLGFIGAIVDMSQEDTQRAPSSVTQFFSLKYILDGSLCPEPCVRALNRVTSSYLVSFTSVNLLPLSPPPRA